MATANELADTLEECKAPGCYPAAAMLRSQAQKIEDLLQIDRETVAVYNERVAVLKAQAQEIERLTLSNISYIMLANTACEIKDGLRAENQRLSIDLQQLAYEVANAIPVNASQYIVRCGTVEAARAALGTAIKKIES